MTGIKALQEQCLSSRCRTAQFCQICQRNSSRKNILVMLPVPVLNWVNCQRDAEVGQTCSIWPVWLDVRREMRVCCLRVTTDLLQLPSPHSFLLPCQPPSALPSLVPIPKWIACCEAASEWDKICPLLYMGKACKHTSFEEPTQKSDITET